MRENKLCLCFFNFFGENVHMEEKATQINVFFIDCHVAHHSNINLQSQQRISPGSHGSLTDG